MRMVTRTARLVVLLSLAGCATGGPPTPDAIFRHPASGDVQWCDKGSVAAAALGGALVAASQGADYAGCKTQWETKGYVRLDSSAKLSSADQQRYESERERLEKARADSIRKN
jgi:hypothetical protein